MKTSEWPKQVLMKKVFMYYSYMLYKMYFILPITLFKMLNDYLICIKFNMSYCWVDTAHSLIILTDCQLTPSLFPTFKQWWGWYKGLHHPSVGSGCTSHLPEGGSHPSTSFFCFSFGICLLNFFNKVKNNFLTSGMGCRKTACVALIPLMLCKQFWTGVKVKTLRS